MAVGRTNAGGAPLNVKVVGGTSAPVSPKENTIWINTDTDITDWAFCATQPTASTGLVWIKTASTSRAPVNILTQHTAWEYPVAAYQYISGAWVSKIINIYKSGAWVGLFMTFFQYGQFDTVGFGTPAGTYSISGNSFLLYGKGNYVMSTKLVDFTPYANLVVVRGVDRYVYTDVYILNSNNSGIAYARLQQSNDDADETLSLNVANINQPGYIQVVNHSNAATDYSYFSKIQLTM